MSPKNWSPNTHFLPSFISSDKLTSHSPWVTQCNKGLGVGRTVNISMIPVKKRFRESSGWSEIVKEASFNKRKKEPAGKCVSPYEAWHKIWEPASDQGHSFLLEMGTEKLWGDPHTCTGTCTDCKTKVSAEWLKRAGANHHTTKFSTAFFF